MCRYLRFEFADQQTAGRQKASAMHWPPWYIHPYTQLQVRHLLAAYRFSGRAKFLDGAIADTDLWLRSVGESDGNVLHWSGDRSKLAQRAVAWAELLRTVDNRAFDHRRDFAQRLGDRLLDYSSHLLSYAENERGGLRPFLALSATLAASSCAPRPRAHQIAARGIKMFSASRSDPSQHLQAARRVQDIARELLTMLKNEPSKLDARLRNDIVEALDDL